MSHSYKGAVHRGGSALLPHLRYERLDSSTDYHIRREPGRSSDRRQPVLPVAPVSGIGRELLPHSGRDEGLTSRAPTSITLANTSTTAFSSSKMGLIRTPLVASTSPESLEQAARLARELRARDARRAGPAGDAVRTGAERRAAGRCQRHNYSIHNGRRIAERLRMFNELNDDSVDVAGTGASSVASGGRPTQYSSRHYVERTRDFQSRRFHYIRSQRKRPTRATSSSTTASSPRDLVSSNIGTAFRLSEETRPTDAYNGEQKTHRVRMVYFAMSRSHPAPSPCARRAIRSAGHHPGPLRVVRP